MTCTVPTLSTADEARIGVTELLAHEDLGPLLDWFRPDGGLREVIGSVEAALDAATSERERAQIEAIATNMRMLLTTERATEGDDPPRLADIGAWDFRLGRERDAIPRVADMLPPEVRALTMRVARSWQMLNIPTPEGHYDAVVAIGGLVRANIGRPESVAGWLRTGGLSTHVVVGMASDRHTSPGEKATATSHGVPNDTEQAALRYGLEQAFSLDPGGWTVRAAGYEHHDGAPVPIRLAIIPMIDGRRANTQEGLCWLLSTDVLAGATSVLQVTTPIYWLANQISARIAVPADVAMRTAGYSMAVPGWDPLVLFPQHYLQEIKAALEAFPRLTRWASEVASTGGRRPP